MNKEKCLVSEAMDKCQCQWCKDNREIRKQQIDLIVKLELNKIMDKIK